MALYLDTAPSEQPISLAEAKEQVRKTASDEDGYINRLIASATAHAEQVTGRALVSQTWIKVLDGFPDGAIALKAPLASIVDIKYIDTNGVEQTLNPAHYQIDPYKLPGWVIPAYGYDWPEARSQPNAVKVRFICGFGNAAAVPEDIKNALRLLVAHWDENREASSEREMKEIPFSVDSLLGPYRIINIV